MKFKDYPFLCFWSTACLLMWCGLMLLPTGCKTVAVVTPTGTNTYIVIAGITITPDTEEAVMAALADEGVKLALAKNPSLKPEFTLVANALNAALQGGQVDSTNVTTSLTQLKVSPGTQTVINSIILAYDAFAGQLVTAKVAANPYLSAALTGLLAGIQQAAGAY